MLFPEQTNNKIKQINKQLVSAAVMAWNQFCKCQDSGLEFSKESQSISSSSAMENLPYIFWILGSEKDVIYPFETP